MDPRRIARNPLLGALAREARSRSVDSPRATGVRQPDAPESSRLLNRSLLWPKNAIVNRPSASNSLDRLAAAKANRHRLTALHSRRRAFPCLKVRIGLGAKRAT